MTPKPLTLGLYARDISGPQPLADYCLTLLRVHAPDALAKLGARVDKPATRGFVNQLFVLLDHLTPEFAYWGYHPSDASQLGVWINLAKLHKAEESGQLVQANAVKARGVRAAYVLVPEGDGLVLYHRRDGREVWRAP